MRVYICVYICVHTYMHIHSHLYENVGTHIATTNTQTCSLPIERRKPSSNGYVHCQYLRWRMGARERERERERERRHRKRERERENAHVQANSRARTKPLCRFECARMSLAWNSGAGQLHQSARTTNSIREASEGTRARLTERV
jgi:hypothetical protein